MTHFSDVRPPDARCRTSFAKGALAFFDGRVAVFTSTLLLVGYRLESASVGISGKPPSHEPACSLQIGRQVRLA